jgi:ATP-dependent Clp protease protease subunit
MRAAMEMPRGLVRARALAREHLHASGQRPFRAEVVNGRGSLFIYDSIGEDWWTGGGVTAKSVQQALDGMKAATALDIFINSPGGDIYEAKAIFAQLERFKAGGRDVSVHVDGIAASAATYIAMVGDRIITARDATWMIHEVWTLAMGNAAALRETADLLDKENGIYAERYATRTKSSVEDVRAWMAAETWMTAAEAKARGFTDEISDGETASDASADIAALLNLSATLRARAG